MNTKETITTRVIVVGSARGSGSKRLPRIRISGLWLSEFGFTAGGMVTCVMGDGTAVLKAAGADKEAYSECVSDIRRKGGQATQVLDTLHNKKRVPHFVIKGLWLTRHGFNIGDIIALYCYPGLIKVIRLDVAGARGLR